jgi:hypothetical protein
MMLDLATTGTRAAREATRPAAVVCPQVGAVAPTHEKRGQNIDPSRGGSML